MDGGHDIARRRMEVYTELQTASEPQWRVHVFHFTGWKPWDQPERGGVYVDDAGQVRVCVCVCVCLCARVRAPSSLFSSHLGPPFALPLCCVYLSAVSSSLTTPSSFMGGAFQLDGQRARQRPAGSAGHRLVLHRLAAVTEAPLTHYWS